MQNKISFDNKDGIGYTLYGLNKKIIECKLCPRLSEYIDKIGRVKVKRFISDNYWARPVPSFGDYAAELLIVGLAPAAHGGNRTGRMFTGDSSGDWVARALYETGFANIPTSRSIDDGLVLKNAYITATVRCAPPDNKPSRTEMSNCSEYLLDELKIMDKNIRVVITLGKIAFDTYCKLNNISGLKFAHGALYNINGKTIISSYHPSRQNTNTRKLTWDMWIRIFQVARSIIDSR